MNEEIKDLKLEADIMVSKQFRKRIRDLLYKEGILRSSVDLSKIDINLKEYFDERITYIEKKIKQPDPLDEIFLTERETKLKKELEEQKSINGHIRRIYKRDLKSSLFTDSKNKEVKEE